MKPRSDRGRAAAAPVDSEPAAHLRWLEGVTGNPMEAATSLRDATGWRKRSRRRRVVHAALLLVLASSMAGCRPPAVAGGAAPDPGLEARLDAITEPTRRLHVVFEWNMADREFRFGGRGVLRLDSAARARVDLFGPRGETLAAAIVEGADRMRVMPSAAARLLPPAALLWSALGVFRPPGDTPLVATSVTGETTRLDYARDATRWQFRFENDKLRYVEWTATGGRRTVELAGSSSFGLPAEGKFRDWTEFRELTLRASQVEQTTGFDPDVWKLPGER
jgi:hypothetical protein